MFTDQHGSLSTPSKGDSNAVVLTIFSGAYCSQNGVINLARSRTGSFPST